MLGEIAEQLAQGFRAPETMTINKFIYLLEALLPARDVTARQRHVTEGLPTISIFLQRPYFTPCNGMKPSET
jgi:hypothetical protein